MKIPIHIDGEQRYMVIISRTTDGDNMLMHRSDKLFSQDDMEQFLIGDTTPEQPVSESPETQTEQIGTEEQVERDHVVLETRCTAKASSKAEKHESINIPDDLDLMNEFENEEGRDDMIIHIRDKLIQLSLIHI